MIPALLYPHITIEEINTLSDTEKDMLLYICNVWAPIDLPFSSPDNIYPISLNIIRYVRKDAIVDRINQAEAVIKDEAKEIYAGLKAKIGIV